MPIALSTELPIEFTIPAGGSYVVISRDYNGDPLAVVTSEGALLFKKGRLEFFPFPGDQGPQYDS